MRDLVLSDFENYLEKNAHLEEGFIGYLEEKYSLKNLERMYDERIVWCYAKNHCGSVYAHKKDRIVPVFYDSVIKKLVEDYGGSEIASDQINVFIDPFEYVASIQKVNKKYLREQYLKALYNLYLGEVSKTSDPLITKVSYYGCVLSDISLKSPSNIYFNAVKYSEKYLLDMPFIFKRDLYAGVFLSNTYKKSHKMEYFPMNLVLPQALSMANAYFYFTDSQDRALFDFYLWVLFKNSDDRQIYDPFESINNGAKTILKAMFVHYYKNVVLSNKGEKEYSKTFYEDLKHSLLY